MNLSKRAYDVLKFIAQIALPAAGTAYLGLAGYWDLPNPDEVVGSVVVVDTLLGTLLGLSSAKYEKSGAKYTGSFDVADTPDGKQIILNLEDNPEALGTEKELVFKNNVRVSPDEL
jgi:hypothetical protein